MICFSCEHLANRQWCRTWKMTEYCRVLEILMVYDLDMHTCWPKANTKKYKSQVREAVFRNSGVGTHAIQQAVMGEAVAAGDIQEAYWKTYEKAKVAHERNPGKQSLEAVGILKQATDMEDKCVIYKIYNCQFNDNPDYIF